MNYVRPAIIALLALGALLLGQGNSGQAVGITVDTTNDELNADGDCSLREAIQAANTDTAVDGCSPGSGVDAIVVPPDTYTLSIAGTADNFNARGDLDIRSDLTIYGASEATTIIDGGNLERGVLGNERVWTCRRSTASSH